MTVTDDNTFEITDTRTVEVGIPSATCSIDAPVAMAIQPAGYVRDPNPNFVWGANIGFQVCDVFTGASWMDLSDRFNTRLIETVMINDGTSERYAIYSGFEPAGLGVTFFDNVTKAASFTIFSPVGTVSQLFPFDNHEGILITIAGSNWVSAREFDTNNNTWSQTALWQGFNFPNAGGNVVFATTLGPNSGTFFVTDGQPAKVWSTDDWTATTAATYHINAGNAPRDMLLDGKILAVVNNGSQDLNTFTYNTAWTIVGGDTIQVGAAIGMDSRTLLSGNIEYAIACENDLVWFVEVDKDTGREVSKTSRDVSATVPGISDVKYLNDAWMVGSSVVLSAIVRFSTP